MPRTLFADTFYWLALIDTRDDWHTRARAVSQRYADARIVTTDEVLVEVLNALSGRRPTVRQAAATNKEYSLTDCVSMLTMRAHGIAEVLTHDHHFEQEGFVLLLRQRGRMPSLGFVDATHIKFAQGDATDMFNAVRVVGQLKAEVLEYR